MRKLDLVSIKGKLVKGASTEPLLIEASDEDGNIDIYVLKLFDDNGPNNIYRTAKEIVGNELAKEFGLPVPEYGLINFDHSLLTEYYSLDRIKTIHNGFKFCSKLEEGMSIFNPNLKNYALREYDMGSVFAFDNILLNTDRGGFRNKPNLLVNDNDFLLIDHELILFFYNNMEKVEPIDFKHKFDVYYFKNHVFYKILKNKRKKSEVFDEFEEMLKVFNLSKFDDIFARLDKFNVIHNGKEDCSDYFLWLKNQRNYVINCLKDRIL
ncbi:MAG: HipA family kinase [Bacteroidota bacterium]